MTKSLFLAVCTLLVVVVLCEEEPQKGGAEQQPGKTAKKSNHSVSFLFKTVVEIIAYECEANLEMPTWVSPKPSRPVHFSDMADVVT